MRDNLNRSHAECSQKRDLIRYRSDIRSNDQNIQLGISNHLHPLLNGFWQKMESLRQRAAAILNGPRIFDSTKEMHLKLVLIQVKHRKRDKRFRLKAKMRIQHPDPYLLASAALPLGLNGHIQLQSRVSEREFNHPGTERHQLSITRRRAV